MELLPHHCITKWKAYFKLNPQPKPAAKEKFGFKTTASPPNVPELKEFEEKLIDLIQKVKFRDYNYLNKFQRQLAADLKKIKNDKSLYVAADKTSNYYRMEVEEYMDLADKAVHKEYKVVEDNVTDQINRIDK